MPDKVCKARMDVNGNGGPCCDCDHAVRDNKCCWCGEPLKEVKKWVADWGTFKYYYNTKITSSSSSWQDYKVAYDQSLKEAFGKSVSYDIETDGLKADGNWNVQFDELGQVTAIPWSKSETKLDFEDDGSEENLDFTPNT